MLARVKNQIKVNFVYMQTLVVNITSINQIVFPFLKFFIQKKNKEANGT